MMESDKDQLTRGYVPLSQQNSQAMARWQQKIPAVVSHHHQWQQRNSVSTSSLFCHLPLHHCHVLPLVVEPWLAPATLQF